MKQENSVYEWKKKQSINPVEIEENVLSMMLYLQKREKENASKNRDKMLRTDDKTLTNINICVIFFFRYKKTVLDSYLLWFHRVFFFSMIRIAVDFSLFYYTSKLTVRWFFLAQFSNFHSLLRRKFAHIFFTCINFRRNKKKSGRVSIPKWLWCSGLFFFTIECFSTQCDVNQGELEEWHTKKQKATEKKL